MTDLMGKSLSKLTVTADTARHLGDDAVVLSKKLFSASASDPLVDIHFFICVFPVDFSLWPGVSSIYGGYIPRFKGVDVSWLPFKSQFAFRRLYHYP